MKLNILILAALAIGLLLAGCTAPGGSAAAPPASPQAMEGKSAPAPDSGKMMADNGSTGANGPAMADKENSMSDPGSVAAGAKGEVAAGQTDGTRMGNKTSNGSMEADSKAGAMMDDKTVMASGVAYVDYTPEAFQAALDSGKTVYLEFYASWCPVCRAQAPALEAGFKAMTASQYSNLAAFRVDFDREKDLERRYGVTSQHTHVIVSPDGQRAYFGQEMLDAARLQSVVDAHLSP